MTPAAAIAQFGKSVSVIRYAAQTNVRGVLTAGATSTLTITMSIQPLKGSELLNLPEAQRKRTLCKGYTATELRTVDQSGQIKADRIVDGAKVYEVQSSQPWESSDGILAPFWKVILAEVNP